MNLLEPILYKNDKIKNILNDLSKDKSKIVVGSVADSQKAELIYDITNKSKKSSVVICSNVMNANKLMQDIKFFSDIEVIYFPAKSLVYYDVEAESKEIENQRMYALKKIMNPQKKIIVTTIDAFLIPMLPNSTYKKNNIVVKKAKELDFNSFCENLLELGYERCDTVEGKGQFAVRGGIIDIFDIENDLPYRIELFGDEVDNIRTFDPLTQRSIDTINEITISYVSEGIITSNIKDKIVEELKNRINSNISAELKENLEKDIEKIENETLGNIFDKYFNIITKNSDTLLSYLEDYCIYFDENERCKEKAHNMCYENNETLKILAERDYLYIPYANSYISFESVEAKLKDYNVVYFQRQNLNEKVKNANLYEMNTKEMSFYKSSFDVLLNDIKALKNNIIVLVFPSKTRVEQVKNYLLDNNIKVEILNSIFDDKSLVLGKVYITYGILSGGYYFSDAGYAIIAESVSGTNYSNKIKKLKKNSIGQTINSFDDLNVGDYVVHENYGIGIYRGIESLKVQDVIKDYIKIEYANNGGLYVPINQLDMVKKYVCDDDTTPKINSLNSKEWEKTKTKVTKHVKEVAKELMLLYAKREKNPGFAFSKDTPWQHEFEDSFEYELTQDQKQSIKEIKEDMESPRVMDRLLCGDVGYGKTEVALRVAFKAVMDKKQVAYLVPTTVLCLQQYKTFKERMEKFGISVEMLSRFRTKAEQTEILKRLVDGKIDILVGTHRLLSKDIFFKDLGLLVIDEEHRFGVKAKESIKELRQTVDVLSMTATPIPRTLHMSMVGIRQMSTLTEPPLERIPVHTYVMEYDDNIIKEAIEKELLRDGQVFYVNNRVEGIENITTKIRELVPYARVEYAHGQMDPHQIEEIMLKFMKHEIDVIVCTTILESGIDIQNANTLIVENSDKLGLAQLYQIRGRVGRSNRLAYAYITYEKNKQISEISEKRLKAIKDFTEFGSGFKIALRDLEIRGAGNLLGKEQHGHMAKVGYEMYLALLEKAVQDEKSGVDTDAKSKVEQEVKIDIDVSAYISDSYIKDPIRKIEMYQRISNIKTKDEMLDVIDELLDRYGDIPKETENLIKIVEIRNMARTASITRICFFNDILKFEPCNFKFRLTNVKPSDILVRVQLELDKQIQILKEKEK